MSKKDKIAKKKVLIIDDEVLLVEALKRNLEHSNYEIITAYDGEDGLKKARNENPDLIVLDLMLPKVDGFMICAFLKKDARYARIPIIILSARTAEEDVRLGDKLGADAYITKPFESSEFLAKIDELTGED